MQLEKSACPSLQYLAVFGTWLFFVPIWSSFKDWEGNQGSYSSLSIAVPWTIQLLHFALFKTYNKKQDFILNPVKDCNYLGLIVCKLNPVQAFYSF